MAALQGARVLSTDYEAAALAFARYNARRNGCQQARFQLMDWRYPTLRRRYDYILASDVIYEARNFGPSLPSCGAIWHVLALLYSRSLGGSMRCHSLP